MHSSSAVAASLALGLQCACASEPSQNSDLAPSLAPAPAPAAGARAADDRARPATLGEVVQELSDSIWIVYHDRNGTRWFGSDGQGVYRVDGSTIVRYTTEDGLCNDHIRQILEDGAGNLYFNTCGGISRFDGRRFQTLVPAAHDAPVDAWKLEPGDLWFTGRDKDNGPYRYDGNSLVQLAFPRIALEDEFFAKFGPVPYSPYCVYTIHRDRRGSIWFGTAIFGVCRYDGTSFQWILEDELTELQGGAVAGVRGIVEDEDDRFWINSFLHRYDASPDVAAGGSAPAQWYTKERGIVGVGEQGEVGNPCFMGGLTDRQGVVWVATYNEGVWRYDGRQLTQYPVLEGGQPITLLSIHEDRAGVLWLGTHSTGTWRFNGQSFERFRP